jgi:hypothetical protein
MSFAGAGYFRILDIERLAEPSVLRFRQTDVIKDAPQEVL